MYDKSIFNVLLYMKKKGGKSKSSFCVVMDVIWYPLLTRREMAVLISKNFLLIVIHKHTDETVRLLRTAIRY